MKISSLGLLLTDYCNAECDCCYMSCSPKMNNYMLLDKAKEYIRQASTIECISSVSITGGEPFACYKELLEIINYATLNNFEVRCSTNGFWASNPKNTISILKELKQAGLEFLNLSTDEFHIRYIPIENIKNIVSLAHDIGILVNIGSVVTNKSLQAKDIESYLGNITKLPVVASFFCLPVGRAIERIEKESFIYENSIPSGRCFNDNTLFVLPDGSVYPCLLTPALCLGSLNEIPLDQILHLYEKNIYCKLFEKYGAKWYIDIIRQKGLDVPLKEKYVCLCDVCNTIFGSSEYLNYYKPWILQNKAY